MTKGVGTGVFSGSLNTALRYTVAKTPPISSPHARSNYVTRFMMEIRTGEIPCTCMDSPILHIQEATYTALELPLPVMYELHRAGFEMQGTIIIIAIS